MLGVLGTIMTYLKKIENINATVDIDKTKKFYLTQTQFVEDCDCEDCAFYQNQFLKTPLSIFKILKQLGVDLTKSNDNESDPEGLWVVMDKDMMVFCHSSYKLIGNFINLENNNNETFETIEGEFRTTIQFYKNKNNSITTFLTIENLNDK